MRRPTVVTIDGPASSGKSSLGQELAKRLGYLYYDTGALYRAVTLAVLKSGKDPKDEAACVRLAEHITVRLAIPEVEDGRQYTVLLEEEDVTWGIFLPEVDANVSVVSAHQGVRRVLWQRQREVAAEGRVVMVGRDIGTVVYPEADLKLYLEASPEVRARRRTQQLESRGVRADYEEILERIKRRDELDQGRAVAPLQAAPDAIVLETSFMTIADEMDVIEGILERFGA